MGGDGCESVACRLTPHDPSFWRRNAVHVTGSCGAETRLGVVEAELALLGDGAQGLHRAVEALARRLLGRLESFGDGGVVELLDEPEPQHLLVDRGELGERGARD